MGDCRLLLLPVVAPFFAAHVFAIFLLRAPLFVGVVFAEALLALCGTAIAAVPGGDRGSWTALFVRRRRLERCSLSASGRTLVSALPFDCCATAGGSPYAGKADKADCE